MKVPLWRGLLVALLLLGLITRQGLLEVFALMLGLATAASELWARYCLTNVTYRRHLGQVQLAFGEETTLTLEFVNAKLLPLAWLLVRDRIPRELTLLTTVSRPALPHRYAWLVSLVSLRWYERLSRTHRLRAEQRGVFQLGPAELSSGDVFGFQTRRREDEALDTLTVYPKIVPVQGTGLPADRPLGDWLAQRRVAEDPLRLATVRAYAPGDSPRYIHWKASARVGTLQTKVFEPSATLALMLAVDVQTLPQTYEYAPDYLEYVIAAAASLAAQALAERQMVGLCANSLRRDGQDWVRLRPGRHPQQLTELLTLLASLTPLRGMPLEEMLHTLMPWLPFGASLVAITALPREPVYEALLALDEAGHPTRLLTVGDTRPAVPERLAHHHLGGRDAWRHLEALELA